MPSLIKDASQGLITTQNIIKKLDPKPKPDPRKPVMRSRMKKGQRVQVFTNPQDKLSESEGIAVLMTLKDGQAFFNDKFKDFETWKVRFEDTGEEADRIVGARHLVIEKKP